jgi:hypothetical protein
MAWVVNLTVRAERDLVLIFDAVNAEVQLPPSNGTGFPFDASAVPFF